MLDNIYFWIIMFVVFLFLMLHLHINIQKTLKKQNKQLDEYLSSIDDETSPLETELENLAQECVESANNIIKEHEEEISGMLEAGVEDVERAVEC